MQSANMSISSTGESLLSGTDITLVQQAQGQDLWQITRTIFTDTVRGKKHLNYNLCKYFCFNPDGKQINACHGNGMKVPGVKVHFLQGPFDVHI